MPEEIKTINDAIKSIEEASSTFGITSEQTTASFEKFQKLLAQSQELFKKTNVEKEKYIKNLLQSSESLKKLNIDTDEFVQKTTNLANKFENLNNIKKYSNAINDVGEIMKGGPTQAAENLGSTLQKGLGSALKLIPVYGEAAASAINGIINATKGYMNELMQQRQWLLAASHSIRDYEISINDVDKAIDGQKEALSTLGMSANEWKERMGNLISAGFKPSKESMIDMTKAMIYLGKEGIGLSTSEINKFGKTLNVEYKKGIVDSTLLLKNMSDHFKSYNVGAGAVIEAQLSLMQQGQDYGLSLTSIQTEMDKAEKAGLSYSQSLRQTQQVTQLGMNMSFEKAAFWGEKLKKQGVDVYQAIADIKTGKVGAGTAGGSIIEEIKKMAGVTGALGNMTGAEGVKFAMWMSKLTDISEETAFRMAIGAEGYKKQQEEQAKLVGKEDKTGIKRDELLNKLEKSLEPWLTTIPNVTNAFNRLYAALKPFGGAGEKGEFKNIAIGQAEKEREKIEKEREKKRRDSFEATEEDKKKSEENRKKINKFFGIKHQGGIIGSFHDGNLTSNEGYAKVLRDEMILTKDQQENMFNMFKNNNVSNNSEININMSGIINESLGNYLTPYIREFFKQEALLG